LFFIDLEQLTDNIIIPDFEIMFLVGRDEFGPRWPVRKSNPNPEL